MACLTPLPTQLQTIVEFHSYNTGLENWAQVCVEDQPPQRMKIDAGHLVHMDMP